MGGGKIYAHVVLRIADLPPAKFRRIVWKWCGIRCGKNVSIGTKVHVSNPSNLILGESSHIGYNCLFFFGGGRDATITIGKNCWLAPRVSICTVSHRIGDSNKRAAKSIHESVVVEEGCWIGVNASILPGVTIAKGCIIGANALVNKSTSPNGLYVGVPAKRIKDLP